MISASTTSSAPEPSEQDIRPVPDPTPDELAELAETQRWWEANQAEVTKLRALGSTWGVTVLPPDQPPTFTERIRIEYTTRSLVPAPVLLEALASDRDEIDARWIRSDGSGVVASEPAKRTSWLLFKAGVLPEVVRDALRIVAPVDLALAVRAWDPDLIAAGFEEFDGMMPRKRWLSPKALVAEGASIRADAALLAGLREHHLRQENATTAASAAAAIGTPKALSFAASIALVKAKRQEQHAAKGREQRIEMLARQVEQNTRWLKLEKQRSAKAVAVYASTRKHGRLSPALERAIKAAKTRWWAPVEAALLAAEEGCAGWDERRLAELLLADAWFIDLIPWTRAKYDERARLAAAGLDRLKALIRAGRG